MTMYLAIEIPSGRLAERWSITNDGHPITGERPEHDDLRQYVVERQPSSGDDIPLLIHHRRSEGRHALAAKVMQAIDDFHQGADLAGDEGAALLIEPCTTCGGSGKSTRGLTDMTGPNPYHESG